MLIELKNITYTYGKDTVYEMKALNGIDLSVDEGEFIALIGHTGSGKSTLIQLLNGLIAPTEGQIFYEGRDIHSEGYDLRSLRTKVGLVFQYPENQLFENDVLTDVCFGPKNQGLSEEECKERARQALMRVGIPEELFEKSPFELSGGQKRRVAIAGILAMKPKVLILDEPTAGLDPQGRDAILSEAERLHREEKVTIILVSHSMEDVAHYAGRVIVLNDGKVAMDGHPREIFMRYKELEKMGLSAPQMTYVMQDLIGRGLKVDPSAITVDEARDSILKALGKTSVL